MSLLKGLIAATYTPMDGQGNIRTDVIPDYADLMIRSGCNGFYVCGSTGEGISLTPDERMEVARAFTEVADGRVPVVIQVGCNSVRTSEQLAAHAQQIGASAVSCNAPNYYKVNDAQTLVDITERVAAAAPDTPFYYYNIPSLTGAAIDMIEYLRFAAPRIPNLAGIKYTDTKVFEYQECLEYQSGRYEVLWGCDEMLLSALVVGCGGAIGSTFASAMPCYLGVMECYAAGRIEEARQWQARSWQLVRVLSRYGNLHAAQKAVWKMLGLDFGPCRLPIPPLAEGAAEKIRADLEKIDFFSWCTKV